MIGLLFIVFIMIVMFVVTKGFIRFSKLLSAQLTFLIIGIYALLGLCSFVYLASAKEQHIEPMSKALEDKRFIQSEQMDSDIREGDMDKIDPSYILATYVVEAQSTELFYRPNEENDLIAYIKYRDDLDSNEIRVTVYKNFLNYNGYDIDVNSNFNVAIVNDIFYITSGYQNLKIANVMGQLSLIEQGFSSSGYSIAGFPIVLIEVPNHITIHDEYDSLITIFNY